MAELTHAYAEIVKAERNADGDLVVYGRATGPDLDLDRQICDRDWLKTAIPAWMSSGANVREMHSSIAAGVGQAITELPDGGWDLKSLIVDPVSARKIERGVLKGYSIGIRNPKVVKDAAAPGGRIVDGQVVEISIVDRPANSTCTLVLAKALKPGPQVAEVIDSERRLIKVEELHDEAGELLQQLNKALAGYDLAALQKGTNKAQIRDARKAIALLAGVVQAEAACLADGSGTASCDIDLVMGAIHAIEYFVNREQEAAMAHVELSDTPDTTKAAAPSAVGEPVGGDGGDEARARPAEKAATPQTPPPAAEKAAEGASTTTETPDLTELVKAAVAEAVAPLQAELAKAMAAPQAGGPVLTRTQQDTNKAAAREQLLAQANYFEAQAAQMISDPGTRQGYLEKAAAVRRLADTTS